MRAVEPRAARRARHQPSASAIVAIVGIVAVGFGVVVNLPALWREPGFALLNIAVTGTLAMVGTYLVVSEGERFTGFAFVLAGLCYPINDLDIYPGWGPFLSYALGGGALFYGALSWGILRYGRPALNRRAERVFIPVCAVLTSGSSILADSFARPEWLGFAPDAAWASIWPDHALFDITSVVVTCGFLVTAGYFVVLMWQRVASTPAMSRGSLKPLAVFGSGLALGSASIYSVLTLAPGLAPLHTMENLIGLLTMGVAAALIISIVRHRLLGAHAVELLPDVTTPESINQYLRELLVDDSAELLYWADESQSLIDGHGLPQTLSDHRPRLRSWITGSDGSRVALLNCDAELNLDLTSLGGVLRVLSLLADNARLNALLRMRLAQLTATRTAEQLALMTAQEQFRRDLHDGVQQTIASIRLDIDGLFDVADDAASRSLVEDAMEKLGTALDQVRNLKSGVDPPDLRFGLKAAIERSIAELHLDATVDIPEGDLGILTVPAYYVARECLTNVHKHSHAQHTEVTIATDGRTVKVCVRDDGSGGVVVRPSGGLAGMGQRVRDLSGDLRIDSPPGSGTSICATIPCVF